MPVLPARARSAAAVLPSAGLPATGPPGAGRPAARSGFALGAALLGYFVITLDALVVSVALPAIGRSTGGGMTGLQWVADGYTLIFAALLLSAGTVSDRIGARRAYGAGLAVFAAASAACGLAPGLGVLVAARLAQGAGAAVLVPASLALIREAFPDPARRARAISVWALGGAAGSACGPVAGGMLSLISWRMIFFVNVPVGLIALALLARAGRSPRRPAAVDWAGQGTAVLAMGALTYAAIEAGARGFGAPRVLLSLAVAIAAAAGFWAAQARGRHPMVPLPLLRTPAMAASAAVGFALNVAVYGLIFVISLYLQQARGLSAAATGLTFLPMTMLSSIGTFSAARLAARFGRAPLIITGQLLIAAGLASVCLLAGTVPAWLLALLMMPVAGGGSLAVPSVTAQLLDSVPAERAGTAGGVLNTARQAGGALAVAIFGALLAGPAGVLPGARISLVIAGVTVLATAGASLALRPARLSRPRPGAEPVSASLPAAPAVKPRHHGGQQGVPEGCPPG
ncbi:MAG TPA: MFS transporter [Streptosporangiaceae bacterium]|nr:MFS transporter [Streptosporangiaceae bacterium]